MGTRNIWTDKELALLKELARAHVAGDGVIDETFARSVERRIPRHPWSGVVRKLHTLGYRARTEVAPAAKDGTPAQRLAASIDRLIAALDDLKRSVTKSM